VSADRPQDAIAARFGAAAGSYDQQIPVQRAVAKRVVSMADPLPNVNRILEVGCGTGVLTRLLIERFPQAEIHAVDVAEPMIARARELTPARARVQWHVADARQFETTLTFPLVASSSALQWMAPLPETLRKIATFLAPGGWLVAGLMVEGTLAELRSCRERAAPHKPIHVHMPRRDEVLAAAASAGLVVEASPEETLRSEYPSAGAFLRKLHEQGVTAKASAGASLLNRRELQRLRDDYTRRFRLPSGNVFATYEVLYIKARKESR